MKAKNAKSNLIEIEFKDGKGKIQVDYNKNVLLYGINGRGKTRTLRTIHLIHELIAASSQREILDLSNELNLESLKVNGNDFVKVLRGSDSEQMRKVNEEKKFISKNQNVLFDYLERTKISLETLSFVMTGMENRIINSNMDRIVDKIHMKKIGFRYNLIDMNNWMEHINRILSRSYQRYINSNRYQELNSNIGDSFYDISILENIQSFLNKEILSFQYNINEDRAKNRDAILKTKEEIVRNFITKTSVYVSTEITVEWNSINDKISSSIKKCNFDLIDDIWANKFDEEKLFDFERIKTNTNKFNSILKKYSEIAISLTSKGEIVILKGEESIDFIRLSSGEKRLVIIFLNLIFVEVDLYLIDEPEMSLSLNYQSKIVDDMLSVIGKKQIMIATHAPYIFNDFNSEIYEDNVSVEV